MLTVLHLITDTDAGGAETFLCRLVSAMDRTRFRNVVVAMDGSGRIAADIRAAGVEMLSLDMSRGRTQPAAIYRLVRILRRVKPQLVQSWLYHADFLGTICVKLAGIRHLVWNLRCSDMEMSQYPRRTARLLGPLARLSRVPDAVLCNSEAGRRAHVALGYRPKAWEIIGNGVDTSRFRPDRGARARFRASLGADEKDILIGVLSRYDPMKGHAVFLRATARLDGAKLVLGGHGVDAGIDALLRQSGGRRDNIHLIGERTDMPEILASLDILCVPSVFGEGFPNLVVEAMSCGIPCVVTDVGDSGRIVGDCGFVVPPSDSEALGRALHRMLTLDEPARRALGQRARERVIDQFELGSVIAQYEEFYTRLLVRQV